MRLCVCQCKSHERGVQCGRCMVYVWRDRVESGQVMSAVSNVRCECGAHDDAAQVPVSRPRHLSRYTLPTLVIFHAMSFFSAGRVRRTISRLTSDRTSRSTTLRSRSARRFLPPVLRTRSSMSPSQTTSQQHHPQRCSNLVLATRAST